MDKAVISAILSGYGTAPPPVAIFSRLRLVLSPTVNVVRAITLYVVLDGLTLDGLAMSR